MDEHMWTIWLVILLVGLGTFMLRSSFILALEKLDEPALFRRVLRFIPSAVLGALVSASLFLRQNTADSGWADNRLVAGLAAALVAWRTRSMLLTIVVGMVLLFLLNHL